VTVDIERKGQAYRCCFLRQMCCHCINDCRVREVRIASSDWNVISGHTTTAHTMPFFVPALAAVIGKGIAAAAGAGIGGTAISMAWNLKDRMKHTTTIVDQLMNLSEGDHISVTIKGNLPFHHAIVVEPVREPHDKVKVVYHSGSSASARVEFAEVDLYGQTREKELYRHHSELLICYSPQVSSRSRFARLLIVSLSYYSLGLSACLICLFAC